MPAYYEPHGELEREPSVADMFDGEEVGMGLRAVLVFGGVPLDGVAVDSESAVRLETEGQHRRTDEEDRGPRHYL